jgi:ubiquinone/menaquinone biosynthesis C-methylase UbiE
MTSDVLDTFKALADEIRLRILRCLSIGELSVAELVTVLDLPQSTVSRHLKPLRDNGLVEPRRDGTSVYYRRGPAFSDPSFATLLDSRFDQLAGAAQDRASVRRVLDLRRQQSRDFFDRMAGRYGSLTEPGGGWSALAAGLAAGLSGRDVADLGAGEGALTLLIARFARTVTAVDHSPRMLRLIEEAAEGLKLDSRIRIVQGDLEALPLPDASVDAAFLSQALHHAAQPDAAVREAARILKPGGTLVLLDLVRHSHEWVREQFADQWLGFEPILVRAWLRDAGLRLTHDEQIAGASPELPVYLAVSVKDAAPTPQPKGKRT